MSAAHTPGPWFLGEDLEPNGACLSRAIMATDTFIGEVLFDDDSDQMAEANARLIAAAPELLAALEGDIDWLDALSQMSIERDMVMVRIRAHRELIAKALGRTPVEIGDGCE